MTQAETLNFRSEFELDESLIYLNSGTQSLCPRTVVESVVTHLKEYERNPTQGLVHAWEKIWAIQAGLADFIGAKPGDLILRPNVTAALNSLIMGTPLSPGSEILVTDTEYRAIVNVAKYRAEKDGLKLRALHLPGTAQEMQHLSEDSLVEMIVRELRPETRMLIVSHVMTGSGLALPLAKIARETRARSICLVVDGAHGTGALPLNMSELGDLDYYAGNLHKWTMGPKGTAFAWVSPRRQDALEPDQIGWTTFESNDPYDRFGGKQCRFAQKHLNAACIDFAPWFALEETFKFWKKHGAERIRGRIRALQSCVEAEMRSKTSWQLISPDAGTLRGPLLSYELPPELEVLGYGLMARVYRDHRVQIASSKLQERWVLRLSPHAYNTEAEIARAAEVLGEL